MTIQLLPRIGAFVPQTSFSYPVKFRRASCPISAGTPLKTLVTAERSGHVDTPL